MQHHLLLCMPKALPVQRPSVIAWNQLHPDSLLYAYFAHLYYGGDDLLLGRDDAIAFVHEFAVEVTRQGGVMDDVNLSEGLNALTRSDGRISMARLVEELCLLLV
ncbi:hypothetical protein SPRG_13470 [Saprolegnia parasitica CBS 223.65]|uniref:Uncharacterized protein n=1 Tax=Saprolegnia parasitica (strain CBS 223.65) TaxID=695850 RepID=A0A067BTT0_SAPPC|nr:hypothetical protein SPRG_13470 [Saprolegnia parasitica CBS 223.65]KDO20215.1 hypothetical protein SPRG_13470 [Saprolegnia parasitica CBS 223.65]|eukprot:XP_012209102.1 hypothetical protein SPRG_13470 [Saprolegnia parasitica CBS 223.65]